MVSRYSVIQYIPNPIADERINIGVLAFDDERVQVRFLSRWDRVRHFGSGEDLLFLQDFVNRMQEAVAQGRLFPGDEPDGMPRQERLQRVAKGWINGIQFTEPWGSLEAIDTLVEEAATTYLIEPSLEQRAPGQQKMIVVHPEIIRQMPFVKIRRPRIVTRQKSIQEQREREKR